MITLQNSKFKLNENPHKLAVRDDKMHFIIHQRKEMHDKDRFNDKCP